MAVIAEPSFLKTSTPPAPKEGVEKSPTFSPVPLKANLEVLPFIPATKMREIAKIGIEPIIPSVELASGAKIEVEGSSCPLSLYSLT